MELLDRQPSENARSYALRVLLHNIITLELAPGSAVSENELSQILKLSRTPVREALIELSKMGWWISSPSAAVILPRSIMNWWKSPGSCAWFWKMPSLPWYAKGFHRNMKKCSVQTWRRKPGILKQADYTRLFELDTDFHRLLFTSVGKARTYGIIHSQMVHFDRLRALPSNPLSRTKSWRTMRIPLCHWRREQRAADS